MDGAYLATPRSDAENAFIIGLQPNQNIWIGINDIDQEGEFISVDGGDLSYTRWAKNPVQQPDNAYGGENGVHIIGAPNWGSPTFWNDNKIVREYHFVCFHRIQGNLLP